MKAMDPDHPLKSRTPAASWLGAIVLAGVVGAFCWACARAVPTPIVQTGSAARGAYLFAAGDCSGCHTDIKGKGPFLAGGAAIATDFGVFYAPNITPDKKNGIGAWSEADFHRAMREGKGKDGEYLYPVFPYPAFSQMSDQDIADLWAYLKTAPSSSLPSRPQQAKFPFGFRPLLLGWRVLFFREGPLAPVAGKGADWNRGRYLAEAVAHCGECHSPRNALGGIVAKNAYAGNPDGPDGQKAPNITPGSRDVGKWTVSDMEELLNSGATPDGDYVGGGMGMVVDGTGKLTQADRHAIAVYIKSLPPRASTPKAAKAKAG
jgi:mono/diheme cytochrome c family protein